MPRVTRVLGLTVTDEDLDRDLVFMSSRPKDKDAPQPFGRSVDLDRSADEVLAEAEALIAGVPPRSS